MNSSSEDHGPVFCEKFQMQVISTGIFAGSNPIHSTLPLLLLQLGLVSSLAGLLQFLLRPLGVPKHVTDILVSKFLFFWSTFDFINVSTRTLSALL